MVGEQINVEYKGSYGPAFGSLGFLMTNTNRRYDFNTCRNVFHAGVEPKLRAAIREGKVEECCAVAEFVYATTVSPIVFDATMKGIEDHFDLGSRSTVRPTNHANIILVTPAPFWATSSMRFSLYTILTRAIHRGFQKPPGMPSDKFDWQILLQETYLDKTRPAVMEFFGGKTYCDVMSPTNSHGWYETFKDGCPVHTVQQYLMDPSKFTPGEIQSRIQSISDYIKRKGMIGTDKPDQIPADDIARWAGNIFSLAARR